MPADDVLLISSWLNTSKDLVVANEQKNGAFWSHVAVYFAACPMAAGREMREPGHCKQRWQKINDLVNKFCGSYEAASRERTSGQNENDVLKLAHELYYNNYKKKFTLEYAWKELRNDQKWCELSASKTGGSTKKRRCDVGPQTATSQAEESMTGGEASGSKRPPGIKAAKGLAKRQTVVAKEDFQTMWSFREKDNATKERVTKMSVLDKLLAKEGPLAEYEEAYKRKLINELMDI
ncbi:glutathione S-transferase T3-like [Eutrema salsugineum]|uniref:glutathione S-transferase T3-like n=1 Tax=Eutrema salsugineum TaxID=72664 RepID=UPI000CED55A3|nr:glutathione S-transferase T3-like [Eutrema salsugineum]